MRRANGTPTFPSNCPSPLREGQCDHRWAGPARELMTFSPQTYSYAAPLLEAPAAHPAGPVDGILLDLF